MAESIILDVCNFLKGKNILIPSQNQWLRNCIAFFRESNSNSSAKEVKDFVFDQWKLADLNDISASSLPNNCKTAEKLILPGKYAVQINYFINISESFYKQLQKIRRPAAEENLSVDAENEKEKSESTGNRTLKMEMTDGVVTLLGFESKPIRKIVEPFIPGVKAILTGPIECRKGVLFLNNDNIDILGGEVDELLIKNAVENVLARELKQPENPNPYKIVRDPETEEMLQDDEDFLQIPDIENIESNQNSTSTSNTISTQNRTNNSSAQSMTSTSSSSIQSRNNNSSLQSKTNNSSKQNRTNNSSTQNSNNYSNSKNYSTFSSERTSNIVTNPINEFEDSFELDDDEEFLLMAAQTADAAEKNKVIQRKNNSEEKNVKERRPSTEINLSKLNQNKQTSLKNFFSHSTEKTEQNPSDKKCDKIVNNEVLRSELEESYSDFMKTDDSYTSIFSTNTEIKSSSNKSNSKIKENRNVASNVIQKKITSETPALTFPPKKYPCTLVIQCKVDHIAQKLMVYDSKWSLSAIVKIKGVEMEADFASECLDKMFGMTAPELQEKRRENKDNPEVKQQLNKILKRSQDRIQKLNCDVKIHFISYIAKPIILEIYD